MATVHNGNRRAQYLHHQRRFLVREVEGTLDAIAAKTGFDPAWILSSLHVYVSDSKDAGEEVSIEDFLVYLGATYDAEVTP